MFNERQQLLQAVRIHDFALTDLVMYLDSHPTCPHGLACFHKHKKLREEAAACYIAKFGPLTPYDATCADDEWLWVKGPWPWEMEGC